MRLETISVVNNRLLRTQIIDTNGNYIWIAYESSAGGYSPLALDYVTDTLGRVISFYYDSSFYSGVLRRPHNYSISIPTLRLRSYASSYSNTKESPSVPPACVGLSGVWESPETGAGSESRTRRPQ